jgi:transposase
LLSVGNYHQKQTRRSGDTDIVSLNKPDESNSLYKERGKVESAFNALNTCRFNIGDMHLTNLDHINKLLALVLFALTWAYIASVAAP